MRIKFALAASLFAVSLAGAAFAQPTYSDDYTNDSDGFAPSPTSKLSPSALQQPQGSVLFQRLHQ